MDQALDKKQINHDIFRLIIPSVLENVLQLLAGLLITAMVGRLFADDISAQGISNRIYHTCFGLFRGLGTGATVLVALHYGKGSYDKCRRTIEQAYLVNIPLAVLFAAVIIIFPKQLLGIFTDDQALIATAVQYSRITACAVPFMAVVSFNTAAFNGQGDTKTPMFIAIAINLVSIVVGYVAIFGVGGIGGWGILGAAAASVCAQVAGALLGIYLLYRPYGKLARVTHDKKFFSLDMPDVKLIYSTGLPVAAENIFWQLSAIIMSRVILGYSSAHYAAYQLGLQVEMLTEMPAAGFIIAATTLTAGAIGQRDSKLFKAYCKQLIRMATIVGIAASALLFLLPGPFMKMVTDKPELQLIGAGYVFIMGFAQIPQVVSKVLNGIIRSSGGRRVPMYISFIGIWLVRVPFVILCGSVLKLDIRFIWGVIAADQISRLLLSMVYMKKKDIINHVDRELAAETQEQG